ncbi:MAG: hypothetical protein ACE145_07760 [Terriglobia bacterium]
MSERDSNLATADDWRASARKSRLAHAESLTLPSGATILAARPEPLEWILAGRIPQRLLAAALDTAEGNGGANAAGMSRDDVLELARFAAQLVKASVVEPAIGDGPDEIPLDEIPVEDRAFIFQWACRALGGPHSNPEDASSPSRCDRDGLERFCQK